MFRHTANHRRGHLARLLATGATALLAVGGSLASLALDAHTAVQTTVGIQGSGLSPAGIEGSGLSPAGIQGTGAIPAGIEGTGASVAAPHGPLS